MSLVTDRDDPRLGHGVDTEPRPQNEVYLILSEEERAKGFVRPVRQSYVHVGVRPRYPTRDLTPEEAERYLGRNYVAYEDYPPEEDPVAGRLWTAAQLASGCGSRTTMALPLAETYAREPGFYGATYCARCQMHKPVEEFVWDPDGSRVGS